MMKLVLRARNVSYWDNRDAAREFLSQLTNEQKDQIASLEWSGRRGGEMALRLRPSLGVGLERIEHVRKWLASLSKEQREELATLEYNSSWDEARRGVAEDWLEEHGYPRDYWRDIIAEEVG